MTDPYWCPVCDFGPGKSLQQVRSHVNSMSGFDGDHDWSDLEPVVREQHADQPETSETTSDDQPADQPTPAGSDDVETDDQPESGADQQETSESTESDQQESGGESAGSDPYEEQWDDITGEATSDDQPADQPESGDGSDPATSDDDGDTSDSTSQPTSQTGRFGAGWALVAGLVLAVAVALSSRGPSSPEDPTAADAGDDADDADPEDSATDTDEGGPSPDPIA